MSLTIEIAPELEGRIRQAAAQEGLTPDTFVLESIAERLRRPVLRPGIQFTGSESKLLQAINQSMAHIDWSRYRELIDKRQTDSLTDEELTSLIALTDEVEAANVERIELLIELAQLRNTTLPALMKALDIKPIDHG